MVIQVDQPTICMKTYLNLRSFKYILFSLIICLLYACDINEEWDDCLEECNGPGLIEYKYDGVEVVPFVMVSNTQVTNFTDSICACDFGLNINLEYLEEIVERPTRECCGYDYELVQSISQIGLFTINTENKEEVEIANDFRLTFPMNDGTTLKELADSGDDLNYGYYTMLLENADLIPASAQFMVKIDLISGETFTHTSDEVLFSQE